MGWTTRHVTELYLSRTSASARQRPKVLGGLQAVARGGADMRRRRFGLLLRSALPVRDELFELAAPVEASRGPDPGAVVAGRELLTDGLTGRVFNSSVPEQRLLSVLKPAHHRLALRIEQPAGRDRELATPVDAVR